MKRIYCLLVILLSVMNVFSQSPSASIRPLTIGDTVPDIVFNNVINYKATSANLTDFKGKLLILDFWATWCPPCVEGLAKVNEIQKEFSNQVMVLPINSGSFGDTREKVTSYWSKRTDIALPTIYDAEKLGHQVFPHLQIPHYVIIDKNGIVRAITSSGYITRENIQSFLNKEDSHLPVKKDILDLNPAILLVDRLNNHNELRFSCQFSQRINGITGIQQIKIDSVFKMTIFNQSIADLYAVAFQKPHSFLKEHLVLKNVKDSSHYLMPQATDQVFIDAWKQANTYCYEYIIPVQAFNKRYDMMLQDLNRFFGLLYGLKGELQKRSITKTKNGKQVTTETEVLVLTETN